ncbi:MAG: efflux RND transporter periplasmic adaptor subunit [Candidatus Lernaella stagnicola]|nr:efflux RND transporter periplasmic adaptor subunit [Candidatus Lernaella stagnicola]
MKRVIPAVLIILVIGYFGYRAYQKAQAIKLDDRHYGTVEADEVLISAQVAGRILEFNVSEGQIVQAGDLLVRIDDTPYAAQKGQVEAGARAADSQKRVVAANLKGVNKELERTKKLLETGSATDMQYDMLTTQADSLRAQNQAINSQVKQAQAAADVVQTQIDMARIAAPISGTVLRTHARVGETAFPGSALLVLADMTSMEINVYVPEPMLGLIKLGEKVEVFHDSDPGKPMFGTVSHVSDTAEFTPKNVQTRDERVRLIYKIKVDIPNPAGVLKIGMPVDVRFLSE